MAKIYRANQTRMKLNLMRTNMFSKLCKLRVDIIFYEGLKLVQLSAF